MNTILYTHVRRAGIWTKLDEWDGRQCRCITCDALVTMTHAVFVREETGEKVPDRACLCDCSSSYDYSFKPINKEILA